jgi:hypothetical protein
MLYSVKIYDKLVFYMVNKAFVTCNHGNTRERAKARPGEGRRQGRYPA